MLMIEFKRFELPNGLRLLVHEDHATPMAAVSLQYGVGSRDEDAQRTGLAHLFEHLMFAGSKNAPLYDEPLQRAGGENNAFTNTDLTNFHITLPAQNIDTALWLEADRMANLTISEEALDVQRRVVVEEFKETCLNPPYGDAWHHISALAYRQHPYRWPTIGLVPEHIAQVTLDEVRAFYTEHYHVSNAILTVAGAVSGEEVYRKVIKYFGAFEPRGLSRKAPVQEPLPSGPREKIVEAAVAVESLYLSFPTCSRTDPDFFALDLLTDVLAEGPSSRLYRRLLKERGLVTTIDAYLTGTQDPGLLIIEAKPREGIELETVREAIFEELQQLQTTPIELLELEKVRNKLEASTQFSDMSILNKAINLAFYESLGDAELINTELSLYQQVSPADLLRVAKAYVRVDRCSTLYYRCKKENLSHDPLPAIADCL